ncbi:MAG: divergent polysaccharide deacetylase family protein, partial [Thermodesulfobacteriota bacterium]
MRKKRGVKGGPGIWGLVAVSFVVGFILAFVLFKYGGLSRFIPAGEEKPVARYVPEKPAVPVKKLLPRVAIVIDDMGRDLRKIDALLKIDAPVTVSVLPHLRHSREVAREAYSKGREVLLHLPMEPKDAVRNNPGKGALLTSMDEKTIRRVLEEDLGEVPNAVGVNNHMGSRFTENRALMRGVLDIIKEKRLFFLDSRTTSGTVGVGLAMEMGVRNTDRNVFLDNRRERDYIKGQIERLVRIAKKNGKAVAIGHPYTETLDVLKEELPRLASEGVEVVNLSELVR